MRAALAVVVLSLTCLAGTLQAQNDCLKNLAWPDAGRWAEYSSAASGKTGSMRYAVVGGEKREGAPLKWIELSSTRDSIVNIYQLLVPGGPADIAGVQEVVIKSGNKPAMKMSGMMLGVMRKQLGENSIFSNLCEGVTFVGEETVKVPAGSFKSLHFHNDKYQSDTWMSPAVPFALVKTVSPRLQIELKAVGNGAKSSITETPKEMSGPGAASP